MHVGQRLKHGLRKKAETSHGDWRLELSLVQIETGLCTETRTESRRKTKNEIEIENGR